MLGADVNQDGERLHRRAYLQLRAAITLYVTEGRELVLRESTKPYHARNWRPAEDLINAYNAANEDIIVQGPLSEDVLVEL